MKHAHPLFILFAALFIAPLFHMHSQSLSTFPIDDPLGSKLQLSFINGTGVAFLSPIDSSTFLRFALDVSVNGADNTNDYTGSSYTVYPDTTLRNNSTVGREEDGRHLFARASCLYSGILASSQASFLYAGCGPFVSYDRAYSSVRLKRDYIMQFSSSSYSWAIGAMGIAGLRTQIMQNVAIHIEYTLAYSHSFDHRSESRSDSGPTTVAGSSDSSEGTTNSFSLSNFSAGITIAL